MKGFCLAVLLLVGSWSCYEANDYFLQRAAWNLGLLPNLCPEPVIETSVIQTTIRQTCGIRPATALPACAGARSAHPHTGENLRNIALEDVSQGRSFYRSPAVLNRFLFGYNPLLTSAVQGLNRCTVTTTSLSSVTDTILGKYTCSDTLAGRLLPDYPFCDGVSEVVCGTVPAGVMAKCQSRKRSVEFPEDFAPSNVYRIEPTQLPLLLAQYDVRVLNPEVRLDSSFQESVRGYSVPRVNSQNVLEYGRAGVEPRALDVTTRTVAYSCYNENTNFPEIPPCSQIELMIQPNCTVYRASTGSISSPVTGNGEYPDNYDGCWIIVAPQGSHIIVTITDFETEDNNDFFLIYEGVHMNRAGAIVSLSGEGGDDLELPYVYTSQTNALYLRFTTDDSSTYSGFKLNYRIVP